MTSAERHRRISWVVALAAVTLIAHSTIAQQGTGDHWVGTWGTAVVGRPQTPPPPAAPPSNQAQAAPPAQPAPFMHFTNQTLRQIVHISIGSPRARVVLSNAFGTAPLVVGAAHIALRDKDATIVAASDRALTFSGQPTIAIPAGALVF